MQDGHSVTRGQESNLRTSGSEPDAATSNCYPGMGNSKHQTNNQMSGRRIRTFTTCFKGKWPAINRSPNLQIQNVLCGSRTRLASLEDWHLGRSVKSTQERSCRRQESNLRLRAINSRPLRCQHRHHSDNKASGENRTRDFCLASRCVTTTPQTRLCFQIVKDQKRRSVQRAPSRN